MHLLGHASEHGACHIIFRTFSFCRSFRLPALLCLVIFVQACGFDEPPVPPSRLNDRVAENAEPHAIIRWSQPINARFLGFSRLEAANGSSLVDIISSITSGWEGEKLCSECHNSQEYAGGYGFEIELEATNQEIRPDQIITGRSWQGSDGWAVRFIANDSKPALLKTALQAWIDGGWQR